MIDEALAALRDGRFILLYDFADREGDRHAVKKCSQKGVVIKPFAVQCGRDVVSTIARLDVYATRSAQLCSGLCGC